jgi:hypothetical protein
MECPLRFFQSILAMPGKGQSANLVLGSAIHAAFSDYLRINLHPRDIVLIHAIPQSPSRDTSKTSSRFVAFRFPTDPAS